MDLIRKDPAQAYYSNALYLPKLYFAKSQIDAALTYDRGPGKDPYVAYEEDIHHYIVPRNFIAPTNFHAFPFPVVDTRIKKFPHVRFQSKAKLDLKSNGETYQRDGVAALLAANHGVLTLRCGAGKTICAIHAVSNLEVPALVLVNDLGLAEQWIRAIVQFTDLSRDDVGFIGAGRFDWKKKITVAAVQTLAARVRERTLPRDLIEWFGVVVADEAHNTAGPAFYHLALTPFHGRRWGLSATPYRTDAFRTLLQYTLGEVVYRYLMPELIPLVYFRQLSTQIDEKNPLVFDAITDVNEEVHLQRIYGYLATVEARTLTIVREAKAVIQQGRQLLLLSQSRPMLERLSQEFPDAGVIHGQVKMKHRQDLILDKNPVIAISKLGRQALDKPVLDTLMVCEPYSDAGVLQQLIGRIQRPEPNKKQPVAVFYDDVNIEPMHKICRKIRKLFNAWPEDQGGRLRWQNTGDQKAQKTIKRSPIRARV